MARMMPGLRSRRGIAGPPGILNRQMSREPMFTPAAKRSLASVPTRRFPFPTKQFRSGRTVRIPAALRKKVGSQTAKANREAGMRTGKVVWRGASPAGGPSVLRPPVPIVSSPAMVVRLGRSPKGTATNVCGSTGGWGVCRQSAGQVFWQPAGGFAGHWDTHAGQGDSEASEIATLAWDPKEIVGWLWGALGDWVAGAWPEVVGSALGALPVIVILALAIGTAR